jgi:nucleoid-associated protein YgaU
MRQEADHTYNLNRGQTEPEWDYDDAPAPEPRVLWIRVAALCLVLALVFWLGRMTAPGNAELAEEVGGLRSAVQASTAEVARLQITVSELQQSAEEQASAEAGSSTEEAQSPAGGQDETATSAGDSAVEGAANGSEAEQQAAATKATETDTAQGRPYVVRPGDTLAGIALKVYGDIGLSAYLAEANDIPDTSELNVGEELTIPPKP